MKKATKNGLIDLTAEEILEHQNAQAEAKRQEIDNEANRPPSMDELFEASIKLANIKKEQVLAEVANERALKNGN